MIKYYTDAHDVDEDIATISAHGGDCGIWWPNPTGGVFVHTLMNHTHTDLLDSVASSNIQISKYTDVHDVDEDRMTIVPQGGRWDQASEVGIMYREMYSTPVMVYGSVASLRNKD